MLGRQRSGAVLCPSCGLLVGVNDERCLNCGRAHPGLWGFAGVFRDLGRDMGFGTLVMDAATVARIGYDGLMTGKRVVVPGLLNALLVQGVRLTPRRLAAAVVRRLQEQRGPS